MQRDPAVAPGKRAVTRPDDLAGRGELVEHRRACSPSTRAGSTSDSHALAGIGTPASCSIDGRDAVDALERAGDVLPHRQEAREGLLRDRLDAAADRRERAHAQPPQHLGVAPLGLVGGPLARSVGQEEAAREAALRLEPLQRVPRDRDADAEPLGDGVAP